MPRTGMTPDQIKDKAIKIATQLIRKHGFERLRLTEIAKEIGVSHAALYSHFADKSALFDIVSERWLIAIDKELDAICEQTKDPCEVIHEWALFLHRAKLEKVLKDPELYRAFDYAAEHLKPFIIRHLENVDRQINSLVSDAIGKRGLRNADVKLMSRIIREATVAFHHPKLIVLHLKQKRQTLLRKTLDVVLVGLNLKSASKASGNR